jgi:hypothetical protein
VERGKKIEINIEVNSKYFQDLLLNKLGKIKSTKKPIAADIDNIKPIKALDLIFCSRMIGKEYAMTRSENEKRARATLNGRMSETGLNFAFKCNCTLKDTLNSHEISSHKISSQ